MIAEERGYFGTAKFRVTELELHKVETLYDHVAHPTCAYEQAEIRRSLLDGTDSSKDHEHLLLALMKKFWNMHGDEQE